MPPILRSDIRDCAVLTFNRPATLNALNTDLLDALDRHLDTVAHDHSRAFIVTGSARAFCVGSDLKEAGGDAAARITRMHRLMLRLRDFPKLGVAAVDGFALGGGFEVALGCRFRIATAAARFGLPEIRLALIPSYGATQVLPLLVGETRALDLMLSGDPIDGETALQWGLVDRIVAPDRLLDAAVDFACRRAGNAPVAERAIHEAVRLSATVPLEDGLDHERRLALEVAESEAAKAGLEAFRRRGT